MIGFTADVGNAIRKLERAQRAIEREVSNGTRQAVSVVASDVKRRVRQPKRVNIQDSADARNLSGRTPVTVTVNPQANTGLVVLRSYWTPVRSNVLVSVYQRLGLGKKLQRPGLYVRPTRSRSKTRRTHESRTGLRYTRFAQSPTLAAWAARRDRGFQLLRHAVRMDRRAALIVVANPAVIKTRPDALAIFARAAARGVRGA